MMRLSESDFSVDNRIWAARRSIFPLVQGGKEVLDAFIAAHLIGRHLDLVLSVALRDGSAWDGSGPAGIDSGGHFFRECIG